MSAASATSRRAPLALAATAALMALLLLASAPPRAEAALSCSTVYSTLMPCLGYVRSGGGTVPGACCSGIQSLVAGAQDTADRRAICTCLKNVAAAAAGGPYISRAAGLPGKCGVPLPYQISANMNCNSIN